VYTSATYVNYSLQIHNVYAGISVRDADLCAYQTIIDLHVPQLETRLPAAGAQLRYHMHTLRNEESCSHASV
jgi:hypothetical protein